MANASQTGGTESESVIRSYLTEKNLSFDYILMNEEILSTYGVRYFPTTCIIDRDGSIAYMSSGYMSYDALAKKLDEAER